MLEGLLASNNAVPKAIIEPPIVLAINVTFGGEPSDLPTEPRGELGGIKSINWTNSAFTGKKLLIECIDVVAEHRGKSHSRYHDPLLWVHLPLGSRNCGGCSGRNEVNFLLGSFGCIERFVKWVKRRSSNSRRLKCQHCEAAAGERHDDDNDGKAEMRNSDVVGQLRENEQ